MICARTHDSCLYANSCAQYEWQRWSQTRELDVLELQRQGTDQHCQSSHTPASPPPFSCAYFLTAPCEHPAISTCCYQVEAEVPQLVLRNPTSVTSTTFTAPLWVPSYYPQWHAGGSQHLHPTSMKPPVQGPRQHREAPALRWPEALSCPCSPTVNSPHFITIEDEPHTETHG